MFCCMFFLNFSQSFSVIKHFSWNVVQQTDLCANTGKALMKTKNKAKPNSSSKNVLPWSLERELEKQTTRSENLSQLNVVTVNSSIKVF